MSETAGINRRTFSGMASAAGASVALAPHLARGGSAQNRQLKVGVIGCGYRGTGAANQALKADANAVLWAAGDVFQEKIDTSIAAIKPAHGVRAEVAPERQFVGLDAYQKVLASGVDVVLLATPPGFRPQHFKAAVDAGKHIFAEKPVAVDMAGVKSVMASAKLAKEKGLCVQHGFCWRYDPYVQEAYQKILSGEMGRVISIYGSFLTAPPKTMLPDEAREKGWSDVEWQVRNWMAFDWLSGGPLVEQAVHTIDKFTWALGEQMPLAAVATGGRAQKNDSGNTYDHYSVAYEFPNGVFCHMDQRQIVGGHREIIDRVFCEKSALVGPRNPRVLGPDGKTQWRSRGRPADMYQNTQDALFQAIRSDQPINHGEYMAKATALGLLGRMAAHTGRRITWKELWESDEDLAPDTLQWGDSFEPGELPVPGHFGVR